MIQDLDAGEKKNKNNGLCFCPRVGVTWYTNTTLLLVALNGFRYAGQFAGDSTITYR